jgi:protocatechuate 3,4-dioxygenase beta subunit
LCIGLGANIARAAGLTLELQIGAGAPLTIQDNGPNDTQPEVGLIGFFGPIGTYTVSIFIAQSKPIIGSPALATMDVSAAITGGTAATLTMKLTDTDFPVPFSGVGTFTSSVGGTKTPGASVAFQSFLDPANVAFGTGAGACAPGAHNTPASPYNSSVSMTCVVTGPYSMTMVAAANVGSGQSLGFDYELLFKQCGTIGDYVWHDLNRDGVQDPNEPGINGVKLLLKKNDVVVATTTTGPHMTTNGYYQFPNLCAGDYTVEIDQSSVPVGFTPTIKNAGVDDSVDNDSDGGPVFVNLPTDTTSDQTIDFGFQTPCTGTIGDFVWHDLNQNGIQDPGEPGIDGVTVRLVEGNQTTVTGPNGYYQFGGLCAGTYTVEIVTPPAGMTASPTNQGGDPALDSNPSPTFAVLTTDNSSDQTLDFGFYTPCTAALGDFVWTDLNRNGVQDPGEPGIQGVTLYLQNAMGLTLATTVTDATGFYQFLGLCGGDFKVVVDLTTVPPTLTPSPVNTTTPDKDSNPNPTLVTLPNNTVDPTIDFGFMPPCSGVIGDFVWVDANVNGIQDVGELGIPGITVELRKASDNSMLAVTTTDANGLYKFVGLCAGDYKVIVVTPPGFPYLSTSVETGADRAVDSNPNPALVTLPTDFASDLTIDFGFWQPAALGDFVWHDINANGQQDGGEPGIAGVVVTLYKCPVDGNPGLMVADQLTDATGHYLFTNLMPGCYYVTFASVATYVPSPANQGADVSDSDSVGGTTGQYTLAAGETNLTVDAGFTKLAALGDYVWNDVNINGLQDVGEPGIGGVTVTLYKCGSAVPVSSQVTDGSGFYLFSSLTPDCYYVTFATPAGYLASPANAGDDTLDSDSVGGTTGNYVLASGETNLTVDAGFYKLAALGDFVWSDLDADGVQDAGEPGIGGVLVTLLKCDGTPTGLTTNTAANGFYLFSNLVPGCYKVQFGSPAGYVASPSNVGNDALDSDSVGGITGNYTLAAGETNLTVDAGFYKLAALGDFVWNDLDADGIQDAGEPGIGGVLVTLLKCDGTPTGLTTNTAANGLYLFSNLVPGCYKVQFGSPAGMIASPPNVGNDAADSDSVGGLTGNYTLVAGETNLTVDAGFYVATPPPCVVATFDFTKYGDSSLTGTAGNIRNFSVNGINLHVSAFSETKPGAAFAPAYLGLYSHGFGVTDGSETGGSNTHVVDNSGRNNYVLFEFSQTVAIDKAYLDYIVGDSDISVWIGTVNNAYNSHISLSAATLASLGFTEVNSGGNTSRWADINAGGVFGNVLVIAAKTTETGDGFKLSKVSTACVPTVCDAQGTFTFAGNTATSGSNGNIRSFSVNGINVKASAFSRADSGGAWATAYLGLYSHGLGVTDSSEGNGDNDRHTVDNQGGRDNYVLFEFSQPVVFNRAFLDYVGADSDVTIWIGTKTDPYNSHLTLSDAMLAGFVKETNLTDSPDSRWADANDAGVSGNVLIIAAQADDTSPEDSFKISKVDVGCVSNVCTATGTLNLTGGNSASSGTAGNIRSYSVGGANVKVSAFSRKDSDGSWATAYLGAYAPGLGVTDGSEGDGSNDRHKVDNIGGRNNYIVLEFSQPVVMSRAFLDAVGADSDVSVWIGTKTDPYNNHQTLSDALLSSLTKEDNSTPDVVSGSRWASVNAAKKTGNIIVISALAGDTTPEDAFKLAKIDLICP